jgi:hypothetical protein
LPHYGNAAYDGMPAGQNGRQPNKSNSTLKEILAKINANQEKMTAWIAKMGIWRKETMARRTRSQPLSPHHCRALDLRIIRIINSDM